MADWIKGLGYYIPPELRNWGTSAKAAANLLRPNPIVNNPNVANLLKAPSVAGVGKVLSDTAITATEVLPGGKLLTAPVKKTSKLVDELLKSGKVKKASEMTDDPLNLMAIERDRFQKIADAKGNRGKILEVGNETTEGTFKYRGKTYNKSDGVKMGYDSKGKRRGSLRERTWTPKENFQKTRSEALSVPNYQTREINKILKENFSNDELLNTTLPQLVKFLKSKGVNFTTKTPTITVSNVRRNITGTTVPSGAPGVDRIPLDQKVLRKPTSSLIKEFNETGQTAINNFRDDMVKLTGFNKSVDDSMKVTSPINRFLNSAVQSLKKGDTTTDEIIEQLNKVDKDALANVLTKNAKIRNKLAKAEELGIKLDDLNLSHMEDVADNWKTSLNANNLFLATKKENQIIQKKLDKDIKNIFKEFRGAKTISEKKEIVKQFKDIKKQLIDNDLVSVIDGKKIGADIDFEKSFKKFSSAADIALNKRLFKKDGGIVGINYLRRPL